MGSQTPAEMPLPDASSPDLHLTHPTPTEMNETWNLNAVSWGSALPLPDYIERETYLTTVPTARDGGVTHWILVDRNLPPNKRPILAACESLRKPALVSKNGVITEGITHGIGSVFGPPAYRGKGYPSRMMKEMGEILKTWQVDSKIPGQQTCPFSILYSDIGKKYYSKFGWASYPSSHIAFPPTSNTPTSPTTPLGYEDLPALCKADETYIRRDLEAVKDSKTHVATLPTFDVMQWHHMREDFVTRKLFSKPPTIKGAISSGPVGSRIWAIFTRTFYGPVGDPKSRNTLYILRLVVEDKTDSEENAKKLEGILQLAQKEAKEWQLGSVSLWNPCDLTKSLIRRIEIQHTEVDRESESIAALMWYGDAKEEVVWDANEKYGWC